MGLPSCVEDATGNNSKSLQATPIVNHVSTSMQDTVLPTGSSTNTLQAMPVINHDTGVSTDVQDTVHPTCSSTDMS